MKKVIVFEDDADDIEMLEHMLIVRLGIKRENFAKCVIIFRDWDEFEDEFEKDRTAAGSGLLSEVSIFSWITTYHALGPDGGEIIVTSWR